MLFSRTLRKIRADIARGQLSIEQLGVLLGPKPADGKIKEFKLTKLSLLLDALSHGLLDDKYVYLKDRVDVESIIEHFVVTKRNLKWFLRSCNLEEFKLLLAHTSKNASDPIVGFLYQENLSSMFLDSNTYFAYTDPEFYNFFKELSGQVINAHNGSQLALDNYMHSIDTAEKAEAFLDKNPDALKEQAVIDKITSDLLYDGDMGKVWYKALRACNSLVWLDDENVDYKTIDQLLLQDDKLMLALTYHALKDTALLRRYLKSTEQMFILASMLLPHVKGIVKSNLHMSVINGSAIAFIRERALELFRADLGKEQLSIIESAQTPMDIDLDLILCLSDKCVSRSKHHGWIIVSGATANLVECCNHHEVDMLIYTVRGIRASHEGFWCERLNMLEYRKSETFQ